MIFLHGTAPDAGSGFLIVGTGAIGLGFGFLIAALVSIWLSRQLGLLEREPRA